MSEEQEKNIKRSRYNIGGAPKKHFNDVRKVFPLRLSNNELALLKKKFDKLNNPSIKFSTFLRNLLLNQKVKFFYIDKAKIDLVYELGKIGTNLNQIAKQINQKGISEELLGGFQQLKESFNEICSKLFK